MRILITGATGFIGGYLTDKLKTQHEVFALTRSPRRTLPSDAQWINLNLTQPFDYSHLPSKLDAVIHLAQSKHYKDFPDKAEDIFAVNVNGAFKLLEYARHAGARKFIFASTGGVYGYSYEKFVETDPVSPINFYLSSKYIAELLVGNYQQFFDTIVFRLFFVYGAGQNPVMLIPRLTRSVLSGAPITLQRSKGILINPIHVSDVVGAVDRALELKGNHLINLGGPQVLSLREIGNIIGTKLGRPPVFITSETAQPHHLIGDITKMKELLGGPSVAFSEGIEEVCSEVEQLAAKPN